MADKLTKRLACGLLCLLLAINGWMAVGEGEGANAGCGVGRNGIFASDELNRMVDENHAQVAQDGWAELRIPLALHGITEDMLDPNAVDAARKLMAGGYEVYVVGGAMRDIIMGYACNDFDLATNAPNPEIERLLDEVTFHDVGDMTFAYAHYPDEIVDVATFYNIPRAFHGQPGIPEFEPETRSTDQAMMDSFRRDITINALYYDMSGGDLVSWQGGLYDLREGLNRHHRIP